MKKEATSIAPQTQLAAQTSIDPKKDDKKKMQSILKVVFRLNDEKAVKERVRDIDEDEPKNLLKFDLNLWDSNRIREYENSVEMIEIAPFEEELTEILVAFFKESSIEKGIKNWRNNVDIFVDSLEEWDDVIGGRNRDR